MFLEWEQIRSQPHQFKSEDLEVNYHVVHLPNPEELREHIGAGRAVNGRIQQSTVTLELGPLPPFDIERMWLLDSEPDDMLSREWLLVSNIGILHPVVSAFEDFPPERVQLFAAPVVPQGIMFNSGTVQSGGLYLVFQSAVPAPIEMTVRIRMEVNVNNS